MIQRCLLSNYLVGNAQGLDDYGIEYRANPPDADSELMVECINGPYENIRRIYPAQALDSVRSEPRHRASRRSNDD